MTKLIPDFQCENQFIKQGYNFIAGIDEVGRGAWAGPVVAGAAILPLDFQMQNYGIMDSKLLSPKRREELARVIKEVAVAWAIGEASVDEIDEIGIQQATFLAFGRAVSKLKKCDFLLIDGFRWPKSPLPHHPIIHGDNISISIAAASIIAKVERDEMMRKLHNEQPEYRFDMHKGYGTKLHQDALNRFGPASGHRKSFSPIKGMVG